MRAHRKPSERVTLTELELGYIEKGNLTFMAVGKV